MLFAIVNNSTMVNNTDLTTMSAAIELQLKMHVAPAWNQMPGTVRFFDKISSVPADAWIIYIIDEEPQVEGALGFHQDNQAGRPDGYIMCKPILENGGGVLQYSASNPEQYTVSGTLSHEVLETFADPFANTYCDYRGQSFALEVCDPVESVSYGLMANNVNVALSDFVYPNYFNQYSVGNQLNYLNTVKEQFSLLPGGYCIVRNGGPGTETQIFGEKMPDWRKKMKSSDFSRSTRRIPKPVIL